MNLSDKFVIWQEKLQQADTKNTNVKGNFLVKSESVPLDQNNIFCTFCKFWYLLKCSIEKLKWSFTKDLVNLVVVVLLLF